MTMINHFYAVRVARRQAWRTIRTQLHVLGLFSGIGGFSLGFERAGMRTAAFCEIDPFCRSVLSRRRASRGLLAHR